MMVSEVLAAEPPVGMGLERTASPGYRCIEMSTYAQLGVD
jgi:hypothetical protein